jgi:hypothetical protein
VKKFEVDYTYPEYIDDVLIVEADSMDEAEKVALDKLSDILPDEVTELSIESVRELN